MTFSSTVLMHDIKLLLIILRTLFLKHLYLCLEVFLL